MTGTFKNPRLEIKGDGIPDWTKLVETGELTVKYSYARGGRVNAQSIVSGRDLPEYSFATCIQTRSGEYNEALAALRAINFATRRAVDAAIVFVLDVLEQHEQGLGHA